MILNRNRLKGSHHYLGHLGQQIIRTLELLMEKKHPNYLWKTSFTLTNYPRSFHIHSLDSEGRHILLILKIFWHKDPPGIYDSWLEHPQIPPLWITHPLARTEMDTRNCVILQILEWRSSVKNRIRIGTRGREKKMDGIVEEFVARENNELSLVNPRSNKIHERKMCCMYG